MKFFASLLTVAILAFGTVSATFSQGSLNLTRDYLIEVSSQLPLLRNVESSSPNSDCFSPVQPKIFRYRYGKLLQGTVWLHLPVIRSIADGASPVVRPLGKNALPSESLRPSSVYFERLLIFLEPFSAGPRDQHHQLDAVFAQGNR